MGRSRGKLRGNISSFTSDQSSSARWLSFGRTASFSSLYSNLSTIEGREDFGMGFATCSICRTSRCFNRGCPETKKVICVTCWPAYAAERQSLVDKVSAPAAEHETDDDEPDSEPDSSEADSSSEAEFDPTFTLHSVVETSDEATNCRAQQIFKQLPIGEAIAGQVVEPLRLKIKNFSSLVASFASPRVPKHVDTPRPAAPRPSQRALEAVQNLPRLKIAEAEAAAVLASVEERIDLDMQFKMPMMPNGGSAVAMEDAVLSDLETRLREQEQEAAAALATVEAKTLTFRSRIKEMEEHHRKIPIAGATSRVESDGSYRDVQTPRAFRARITESEEHHKTIPSARATSQIELGGAYYRDVQTPRTEFRLKQVVTNAKIHALEQALARQTSVGVIAVTIAICSFAMCCYQAWPAP